VVATCGVADQSSGFIEYGQVVVLKQDLGQWWWWRGWCYAWHEYSQYLCASKPIGRPQRCPFKVGNVTILAVLI
jgi:hypothetical protein